LKGNLSFFLEVEYDSSHLKKKSRTFQQFEGVFREKALIFTYYPFQFLNLVDKCSFLAGKPPEQDVFRVIQNV